MSQHTPGPWKYDWGFIVAPDPSGRFKDVYIAEIATRDEDDRLPPADQIDANAALLAASPKLLAAVKAAHALLTDPDATDRDADRVTRVLAKAIQRATGEAP